MKTERIEFMAPPGLKSKLQEEASKSKISVGELIRQRFEPSDEEKDLIKLTAQLRKATAEASEELACAIAEIDTVVNALQERRKDAERRVA